MDAATPSTPFGDGRDPASGRFVPGWRGGPGNPHGRRVGALRAALLDAVTDDDFRAVAAMLVSLAKGGELAAIRELLDRVLGRPVEADLVQRLEEIEAALLARKRPPVGSAEARGGDGNGS